MKRALTTLLAAALLLGLSASPASAAFGFKALDLAFTDSEDKPAMQAGSHPYAITTLLEMNGKLNGEGKEVPDEELKDLLVNLPPGLVGTPDPVPHCSSKDFLEINGAHPNSSCPDSTAVGTIEVATSTAPIPPGSDSFYEPLPVYNLVPAPGTAAKIGFVFLPGLPVTIEFGVNPDPPYNLQAHVTGTAQAALVFGSRLKVWGVPADPSHDSERGSCLAAGGPPLCPVSLPEVPFQTLPRTCSGPLVTRFEATSWQNPSAMPVVGETSTHDLSEPPQPLGLHGCEKLAFSPSISARPTTEAAQSPSGLDFSLDVADEGLTSATGLAQSDIKKAVVTLPAGMTVNPAVAEGLEVCSPAQLRAETPSSAPGAGCPNASKIGTVEVESPLLQGTLLKGSLYQATQDDPATTSPGAENPFDSLIALYMVITEPKLGVIFKQPLKVEPDPTTGQLTTIADNLPQWPFSHFRLHFREGTRSPLASPPACGTYNAKAVLTPTSGSKTVTTNSLFKIVSGSGGTPCPPPGTPPFKPGLDAGTLNNAAGHYSPFYLRLSRNDGEQEFTRFSIKLPPGITGKLAGIPFCADAAIEGAKAKTGAAELASPSCPSASEVGHTLVGAGVGPSLAYAPGKVYLAGPYNGSALSIAAITAAKVGPFDLGTVVVREALKINPETAEVFIDATGSDPIPHIIDGVVVHARDIRVYVDKPDFVLNPTSCERTSTASTVLGSGLNFGSESDDQPVTVTSPFQAADCASLGFKPKLKLSLKGGTKRGDNPAFKAVLTYPKGSYANIAKAQVTLPHSEFLDQSHIKTICTRVQFKEGTVPGEKCPKASIYGYASAITPLLDEPIQGPVYLRSSSHPLPDLVAALHSGKIDVNLVGRIDSVRNGRIRNTFDLVPDAPVTKFTLTMQGGKKGLLVNSTNLCKSTNRAIADFTGQNGKKSVFNPALEPKCGKARKGKAKQKRPSTRRILDASW